MRPAALLEAARDAAGPGDEFVSGTAVSWDREVARGLPRGPGVYVIELSGGVGDLDEAFDEAAVRGWIKRAPEMTLGGERPTVVTLTAFLAGFLRASDRVVYVGKAASLRDRVRQFIDHWLGDPRPHRGGRWIKTLKGLGRARVHTATVATRAASAACESAAIGAFWDRHQRLPFGNLVRPPGWRKQRALRRQSGRGG